MVSFPEALDTASGKLFRKVWAHEELRTCFLNGFGTFLGAETGFLSLKMAVSLPKVWSNSSQKPGFFFKKHALRYNQLVVLPPEIGLLTNLRILHPGL